MTEKSFHEVEYAAWLERAGSYDELFSNISAQAIAPILNGLGDLRGKQLLDAACGTGHLVAAASKRGAISVGIDFSEPMIAVAQANYPGQRFRVADATQLPYDDASFEAVSCAFGLSHMEFPQKAVQEAYRVLRPGGSLAFTLWYGPDDGADLLAITQAAFKRHVTQEVVFPQAWTLVRHANHEICEQLVKQAGFKDPTFLRLPIASQSIRAQTVFDVIRKTSVRASRTLEAQSPAVQKRITEQVLSEIESRRVDGIITIGWPALLTIAQRPA